MCTDNLSFVFSSRLSVHVKNIQWKLLSCEGTISQFLEASRLPWRIVRRLWVTSKARQPSLISLVATLTNTRLSFFRECPSFYLTFCLISSKLLVLICAFLLILIWLQLKKPLRSTRNCFRSVSRAKMRSLWRRWIDLKLLLRVWPTGSILDIETGKGLPLKSS